MSRPTKTTRRGVKGLRWLGAGAAAGVLQALAFSPEMTRLTPSAPFVTTLLALGALVLLLHRVERPSQGAWAGWGFGTVWLVGGTGWMYVSLHRFGGLPSWLAGGSVLLLCAALSLYLALACAAWVRWRRRRWLPDALLLGALWLLAEAARALIFTGFPWAASGYTLVDSPLVALAPWLGVYGMGQVLITVVAAVVLVFSYQASVRTRAGLLAGTVVLLWAAQAWLAPVSFVRVHGRPLDVTLLQGNVPQSEKFEPQHQGEALLWHAKQLVAAKGDLVVAPETAIPLLPSELPPDFWAALLKSFHQGGRSALIGVPLGSFEHGYTNSVIGVSKDTRGLEGGYYRYNKHHLVPFGEFIPWGFRWFVDMMNMPLGDFTRGPRNAPSFEVAGQWVAPNICYEDLFGEELAARFVGVLSPAPTILANVSNLAWFGEEVAIHQHLQIARLRSLEFQRPTIRSTNTGATVVIDHLGVVTDALSTNTQGVLRAQVQGTSGLTPFARWAGPWGLWPLIGLAVALVLAVIRRPAS